MFLREYLSLCVVVSRADSLFVSKRNIRWVSCLILLSSIVQVKTNRVSEKVFGLLSEFSAGSVHTLIIRLCLMQFNSRMSHVAYFPREATWQ